MRYLLPFVILLAACAPMRFENNGSPNKFEDDKYDCELVLGYRGQPRLDDTSKQLADILVNSRAELQRCLERKGWRLAQQ
jgi:hypothetical protein